MISHLEEYYGNEKNVFNDLGEARKGFTSTDTTEKQWDQIEKTLGLMYLYCPEDLMGVVQATLEECSFRRAAMTISRASRGIG